MEKENDIQRTICEYLQLKHYFFWRQNTQPAVQTTGGQWTFRRMGKYAMRGVPDIIIVRNGTVIFLEVKSKNGVLSDAQLEFQKNCILQNVRYHMVKSLEDVVALKL